MPPGEIRLELQSAVVPPFSGFQLSQGGVEPAQLHGEGRRGGIQLDRPFRKSKRLVQLSS